MQIACISPTSFNSAETMNTLRYATRAKRMKTKPVVIMVPRTNYLSCSFYLFHVIIVVNIFIITFIGLLEI